MNDLKNNNPAMQIALLIDLAKAQAFNGGPKNRRPPSTVKGGLPVLFHL